MSYKNSPCICPTFLPFGTSSLWNIKSLFFFSNLMNPATETNKKVAKPAATRGSRPGPSHPAACRGRTGGRERERERAWQRGARNGAGLPISHCLGSQRREKFIHRIINFTTTTAWSLVPPHSRTSKLRCQLFRMPSASGCMTVALTSHRQYPVWE